MPGCSLRRRCSRTGELGGVHGGALHRQVQALVVTQRGAAGNELARPPLPSSLVCCLTLWPTACPSHSYEGVYTKRTGDRRDGLAMFWRADELRPGAMPGTRLRRLVEAAAAALPRWASGAASAPCLADLTLSRRPPPLHCAAVKQRMIKFNQLGLKDNVAQLVVFQRRGSKGGGAAGSCCSSEASGSSLSGQKRRQDDEVAPRARHMRFDSGSEGEEGGSLGAARRRSGNQPRGAAVAEAAAAVEAITVEDVVDGVGHDASASSLGAVEGSSTQRIEGATEPVDAAEAADSGEPPRLPELLVANIHVLFSPKRGDLKLGQVRVQGWGWGWCGRRCRCRCRCRCCCCATKLVA